MEFSFCLLRILSLSLTSWVTALASPQAQLEKNLDVPTESPFKLTMSIDHESYPTVPDVIDGAERPHLQLVLDLKLHFTNQSKKVVRFDKDCIGLSDIVVYDSPIRGPSEPILPDGGMISHKWWLSCPDVADKKFLVILPGKSYETTLRVKFEVVNQGPFHPPESLRPGKYFLEITMNTWWEIDGQDESGKEMSRTGVRILHPVTSEHMGFVVERKSVKRRG